MKHRSKTFPSDVFFTLALQAPESQFSSPLNSNLLAAIWHIFVNSCDLQANKRPFSRRHLRPWDVFIGPFTAVVGYSRDHHLSCSLKCRDSAETFRCHDQNPVNPGLLYNPRTAIRDFHLNYKFVSYATLSSTDLSNKRAPITKTTHRMFFTTIEISAIVGWQRN